MLLDVACAAQATVLDAERTKLVTAVRWLAAHVRDDDTDAAVLDPTFTEAFLPLGGDGAPLVAESAVVEWGPALGVHPRSARTFLADALELGWRLPNSYARVASGDVAPWIGRRLATLTRDLDARVAAVVDERIAPFLHGLGPVQVLRFVVAVRDEVDHHGVMTELETKVDQPHLSVDRRQVGYAGTLAVTGMLDLVDAHDLDDALTYIAGLPALEGLRDSDARRARAAGLLARAALGQDELGLFTASDPTPSRTPARAPRRRTVLYLHLNEAAVRGAGASTGRVENTGAPVSADQVATWCGRDDTDLVVTPVRDLASHVQGDAYERSTRAAELVALRDATCVFPWCTRPARALTPDDHGADCDHIQPWAGGGATCTCNLAPLCRSHHRAKTHGRGGRPPWRYRALRPGLYLWTSPRGRGFVRDATGTYALGEGDPDPP